MKRHIRLNSSAIRHSSCIRKVQYVLDGYHEVATSNDIVWGNCFHDFAAEFKRNGGVFNDACKKGWAFRDTVERIYTKYRKDHLNDFAFFKQVCFFWSLEHSSWNTVSVGGKACVELGWLFPFYTGEHVDISLCGTIDDICLHKENAGAVAIRDYKTTSASDPADYFNKYRLSSQLMTYYYGLTQVAKRGLAANATSELAKLWLNASSRHVFIEGIFLATDPTKTKFMTSDAFEISDERIAEYEMLVMGLCKRLDVPLEHKHPREGLITRGCESEGYGRKCSFFEVCAAATDDEAQMNLTGMFAKEEDYNPLLA